MKPFVDGKYRTLADRENTAIGGGSLGALISMYVAKTQNDKFGRVVALSPWLLGFDRTVWLPHVAVGVLLAVLAFVTHTVPGYDRRQNSSRPA